MTQSTIEYEDKEPIVRVLCLRYTSVIGGDQQGPCNTGSLIFQYAEGGVANKLSVEQGRRRDNGTEEGGGQRGKHQPGYGG